VMNDLEFFILEFFTGFHTPLPQPHLEGLTVAECIDACDIDGATGDAIREAVVALVDHGHLYATVDDEHYLATDPVAALNLVDEPIVVAPPPGLIGVGALVGLPAGLAADLPNEDVELVAFVLNFFHNPTGEHTDIGRTVAQCVSACDVDGGTEEALRRVIESCETHGYMYATIDDEHYQVTH